LPLEGTGMEETDGDRANRVPVAICESKGKRKLSSKFPLLCTADDIRKESR
jgi:hypothetical protein